MKLLVAVKRVVDYNVRIRVKGDGSDVELANVKMGINPFCEIAVEEGVRLREAGVASELVVVTFGPEGGERLALQRLALGLHDVGEGGEARLVEAQVHGHHGGQRHAEGLEATVYLAGHLQFPLHQPDGGGEGGKRPVIEGGEHLPHLVVVGIDGPCCRP